MSEPDVRAWVCLWLRELSGPLRANGSVWATEACGGAGCWRVINVAGSLPAACSPPGRGPPGSVAHWAREACLAVLALRLLPWAPLPSLAGLEN